ncbi:adenylate/guanylate cyclase domain-containing protein [candidate division KSB1 bacterium]|nr:adenylate/guanylate cyclase domain-containing protein [candidate division KSB1 bacterium]
MKKKIPPASSSANAARGEETKFTERFLKPLLANRWVFGSGISLFAIILAIILSTRTVFENLELKSYDLRFSLRGTQALEDSNIVIVDIDDQSFFALKLNWPFPRPLYAKLIDNLTRAGARLILFDVTFTEPSQDDPRGDQELALAAARAQRVIFAGKLEEISLRNGSPYISLAKPIPPLLKNAMAWASISITEDPDGFMRRYPLFASTETETVWSLAVQAYLSMADNRADLSTGKLRLNDKTVPAYIANTFLINFRGGAKTFPTYSFSDVLDDREFRLPEAKVETDSFDEAFLPSGVFKDKIVFIGASAEELQDNKLTPFFSQGGVQRKMPGVEVHAQALSTIARGDFIKRTTFGLELLLMALCASVTMLFVLRVNALLATIFTLVEILLWLIVAQIFFTAMQLWLPVVAPLLGIVLSYFGNLAQTLVTERRERRRTRKVFEQYVSESIVNSILASGKEPKFGGEKLQLTVLFSDIRGFTTYCEKRAPEMVVQRLNEYLTLMTEVIFKHEGTLDKFVGDEIMALFGAPVYFENHAEKACETACAMITSLRELQKRWSAQNEDYFQIGIGINTGTMIVGNLGAQQRFDYTVIGDEVNLGARLEGANKQYATSIIISESTYKQVKKRAHARELDLVRVKGKKKPVKIYELRGMEPLADIEEDLIIATYTQGLTLYKQRQWYSALREFNRVLRYFPSDGPSRVYVERCLDYIAVPPPANWDGVYEFKTK